MEEYLAVGTEVWVESFLKPRKGVITAVSNEDPAYPGKVVYDVKLLDEQGETNVILSGLLGYRVHKDRLGAARDVYYHWASKHRKIAKTLDRVFRDDCWEDPDKLIEKLKELSED